MTAHLIAPRPVRLGSNLQIPFFLSSALKANSPVSTVKDSHDGFVSPVPIEVLAARIRLDDYSPMQGGEMYSESAPGSASLAVATTIPVYRSIGDDQPGSPRLVFKH